ncbi:MAG: cysteine desulfurase, partial [Pikeienuella sp.]
SMLDPYDDAEARPLTAAEQKYASADGFDAAYDVVRGNCSFCHAREPGWEGLHWPPKGVVLETKSDVARHANAIYLQAGISHAMPPPNAVQMSDDARRSIVAWIAEVRASN